MAAPSTTAAPTASTSVLPRVRRFSTPARGIAQHAGWTPLFEPRERSVNGMADTTAGQGTPLVTVAGLRMHFPTKRGGLSTRSAAVVKAVDDVSFEVRRGETLSLVGESGCGKSTTGRAILHLYRPTSGRVTFDGIDLTSLKTSELRAMRRRMQMIFQDPYASLNPRMTVGEIIREPLLVHGIASEAEGNERVKQLLELVRLNPAFSTRYPHEFSGGQRQRIGIARALYHDPPVLVLDEATSSLDVASEMKIVESIKRASEGRTSITVAHRAATVKHCNRVIMLDQGTIVSNNEQF